MCCFETTTGVPQSGPSSSAETVTGLVRAARQSVRQWPLSHRKPAGLRDDQQGLDEIGATDPGRTQGQKTGSYWVRLAGECRVRPWPPPSTGWPRRRRPDAGCGQTASKGVPAVVRADGRVEYDDFARGPLVFGLVFEHALRRPSYPPRAGHPAVVDIIGLPVDSWRRRSRRTSAPEGCCPRNSRPRSVGSGPCRSTGRW